MRYYASVFRLWPALILAVLVRGLQPPRAVEGREPSEPIWRSMTGATIASLGFASVVVLLSTVQGVRLAREISRYEKTDTRYVEELGGFVRPELVKTIAYARKEAQRLGDLPPRERTFSEYFSYYDILTKARDYRIACGEDQDGLAMLEGYVALTRLLNGETKPGESGFRTAVSTLEARGSEDAKFYAEQLKSVRAFFENQ